MEDLTACRVCVWSPTWHGGTTCSLSAPQLDEELRENKGGAHLSRFFKEKGCVLVPWKALCRHGNGWIPGVARTAPGEAETGRRVGAPPDMNSGPAAPACCHHCLPRRYSRCGTFCLCTACLQTWWRRKPALPFWTAV